jgi:hypothetical protein
MYTGFARSAFVIVVLAAIGSTAFRVATAPERIKERRNTARSVCVSTGGEWVHLGSDEVCQRSEQGAAQAKKTPGQ